MEAPVYNVTTSNTTVNITWKEVLDNGKKVFYQYPYDFPVVWYPDGFIITNIFLFNFLAIFLHTIPAYLIDFLMFIFRQPRL